MRFGAAQVGIVDLSFLQSRGRRSGLQHPAHLEPVLPALGLEESADLRLGKLAVAGSGCCRPSPILLRGDEHSRSPPPIDALFRKNTTNGAALSSGRRLKFASTGAMTICTQPSPVRTKTRVGWGVCSRLPRRVGSALILLLTVS